jgi:Ca2+/H+ antiporter, TMEM165/GDT1 family
MKRFWFKKGLMFITLFLAAIIVFGAIVMGLWNAILPAVIGVKAITFIQALGILVLSKILFGGFGRRGGWQRGRHDQWKNNMREKFASMTPQEKEKFKSEWKNRCGGRGWRMDTEDARGSMAE